MVGRDPTDEVRALGRLPGVLVTGAVPDVRPYLARAEVVVAPLSLGSGVKHKVPIAMAMRKAIVSSSNGVQGLDVVHGEHAMIADTPGDFAAHVAALLATARSAKRSAARRASWRWRGTAGTASSRRWSRRSKRSGGSARRRPIRRRRRPGGAEGPSRGPATSRPQTLRVRHARAGG